MPLQRHRLRRSWAAVEPAIPSSTARARATGPALVRITCSTRGDSAGSVPRLRLTGPVRGGRGAVLVLGGTAPDDATFSAAACSATDCSRSSMRHAPVDASGVSETQPRSRSPARRRSRVPAAWCTDRTEETPTRGQGDCLIWRGEVAEVRSVASARSERLPAVVPHLKLFPATVASPTLAPAAPAWCSARAPAGPPRDRRFPIHATPAGSADA
jgi:hypothetical protein